MTPRTQKIFKKRVFLFTFFGFSTLQDIFAKIFVSLQNRKKTACFMLLD